MVLERLSCSLLRGAPLQAEGQSAQPCSHGNNAAFSLRALRAPSSNRSGMRRVRTRHAQPVGVCCAEDEETWRASVPARVARGLRRTDRMSQKSVEIVIGRLATDEGLRARFIRYPQATLGHLREGGLDLNPGEVEALLDMPVGVLNLLAAWVHPRLQKI